MNLLPWPSLPTECLESGFNKVLSHKLFADTRPLVQLNQLELQFLLNPVERFVSCFEMQQASILGFARNDNAFAMQIHFHFNLMSNFKTKIMMCHASPSS